MDAVVQYAIDQGLKVGIEAFEKWRDDLSPYGFAVRGFLINHFNNI